MHTTDPSSQILSYSSGIIPEVIGRDEPVEEITLGSGSNGSKDDKSIEQEIEQTITDARVCIGWVKNRFRRPHLTR